MIYLMFNFIGKEDTQTGDTGNEILPAGSLPKWPQLPELSSSETRNIFWVQGLELSSTAFPGPKQKAR